MAPISPVRGRRRFAPVAAVAVAALIGAVAPLASAWAQSATVVEGAAPTPLEARRDALFIATLNDPANLDVAFEYAMVSAELGDYEGAIATLERMLVFAPNLPRVQLELGVLYYRIGARDMARSYLGAVSREDAPPAVRARVDTFLAEIDRQDRRLVITGAVTAGVQYQSNANTAPGDDTISINGIELRLDEAARASADGIVFALANAHVSYDLRNQGDLIEADVATYHSHFFDQKRLNLSVIEGTLGPSFALGRVGLDRMRLGVYGILGANALGNSIYSTSYGAGARLQTRLTDRLALDTRYEYRALNYDNSDDYPTVRLQSGDESRFAVQLSALATARLTASAAFNARWVDGRTDFRSFGEYALSARSTLAFNGPTAGILADGTPWAVSLAAGALWRNYDGPDPIIDLTEAEDDVALWAEAGLSIPLENAFAAFATAQVRRQTSNYDTRDFANAIVTFGLTKRF